MLRKTIRHFSSTPDYYTILGIARTATKAEVRSSFLSLTKQYHPDVNPSPDATSQFRLIREAYGVLSNPLLRQEYDSTAQHLNSSTAQHPNASTPQPSAAIDPEVERAKRQKELKEIDEYLKGKYSNTKIYNPTDQLRFSPDLEENKLKSQQRDRERYQEYYTKDGVRYIDRLESEPEYRKKMRVFTWMFVGLATAVTMRHIWETNRKLDLKSSN